MVTIFNHKFLKGGGTISGGQVLCYATISLILHIKDILQHSDLLWIFVIVIKV